MPYSEPNQASTKLYLFKTSILIVLIVFVVYPLFRLASYEEPCARCRLTPNVAIQEYEQKKPFQRSLFKPVLVYGSGPPADFFIPPPSVLTEYLALD